jgi:hypothetical protein
MKLKTPQKILIFTISFSLTFNSLFFTILNVNAQTSGVSKLPAPGLNDNAVAGAGDLGSSANSVSSPVGGGLPVYDEAANQTLFGILQSVTAVDYSSGITAGNTGVVAAETSALTTKETVLDIAVWGTINALLRQLTATTINWINSGFEGSPMYVQDLEQFLTDRANVIATEFINNLGDKMGQKLTSMPYSSDVQYALRLDASSRGGQMIPTLESNQYNDLTGGGSNGFSKGGGWNAWYQLTQNPGNNPMEVYLAAKSAMENAIQNDQNNQKEQLDWGEGFFSWRKCEQYSVPGVDSYNDMTPEEQSDARQNSPSTCTKWGPVQTPGTTIKDQLNEHLSEDLQRIGLATELGQIVDAFLAEMAKKALSSAGLSGKGDSSSGGGGMGSYGNIGDWLDPDAFSQLTSNEECNSQNDAMDKIKSIIDPIMSNMSQSKPQAQNFDPKVIIKTIFLLGASIIQDVHERQQGNENPTNFQETIKGVSTCSRSTRRSRTCSGTRATRRSGTCRWNWGSGPITPIGFGCGTSSSRSGS